MSTVFEIPAKQKALVIPQKHASFVVAEVDVPQPGPGEVLVRAEAVGLNYVDYIMQATGYLVERYPWVVGYEAAGTVVQVGEGVTSVAVGDRVFHPGATMPGYSTFKHYNMAAADLVGKIPANITVEQAASLPLCLDTAALGLYAQPDNSGGAALTPPWGPDGLIKYKGQSILVIGGSSSVGQYVIQLARISGYSPIVTTASLKNANYLKSLGATHIIDRNLPFESQAETVQAIIKESPRTIYLATPLPELQNAAYDLLAPGGIVIIATPRVTIDENRIVSDKKIAGIFGSSYWPDRRAIGAEIYKHIPTYLASGELKPNNVEVIPGGLDGIPDALKRLERREVSCMKLIVRPQDTV